MVVVPAEIPLPTIPPHTTPKQQHGLGIDTLEDGPHPAILAIIPPPIMTPTGLVLLGERPSPRRPNIIPDAK